MAGKQKVKDARNPYYSNHVGLVGFAIGAEVANARTVSLQLQDNHAKDLYEKGCVRAYLAADSAGNTLAAVPDGGVVAGMDGLVLEDVTDLVFTLISEDDGDIDLVITESTAKSFYLAVILPNGKVAMSPIITFA